MERFVCYARVSTKQQGSSGLGLDGQKKAMSDYIARVGGELVEPVFVEVESGRKNSRPVLAEALSLAKKEKAVLLTAKLDRLARSVSFVSALQEAKVKFRAVDMPDANELMINVMASLASYEAKLISDRTRAGLEVAKLRGKQLGNNLLIENGVAEKWNKNQVEDADAFANRLRDVVMGFKEKAEQRGEGFGCSALANELNNVGIRTKTGKTWTAFGASRLLVRLGLPSSSRKAR